MQKLSSFGRGQKFVLKSHLRASCTKPFNYDLQFAFISHLFGLAKLWICHKILTISPGLMLIFVQRAFLVDLFLGEFFIFGTLGLLLVGVLHFKMGCTWKYGLKHEDNSLEQLKTANPNSPWACIREGLLSERYLHLRFRGALDPLPMEILRGKGSQKPFKYLKRVLKPRKVRKPSVDLGVWIFPGTWPSFSQDLGHGIVN